MAITITHPFVSVKADGVDATLVQPSDWNDDHTVALGSADFTGPVTITNDTAGDSFKVSDATGDTTPFVIDATGQVLVGGISRGNTFASSSGNEVILQVEGTGFSGSSMQLIRNQASVTAPHFVFGKTRSATAGGNAVVVANDQVGVISFQASDGTNLVQCASITAGVDGTPANNDMPGRIIFATTAAGASTSTERFRVSSTGLFSITGAVSCTTSILSSGATSGIGYTAGAGGTVTQAASRTTGVTINKVSGAITLVSAAGSATYQSFTVTNSAVAATDTISVNQKSGTDLNEIHVTAVAAGSFRITFRTTGGTTVDQPVFNFNVIKGVAA